MKRKRIVTSQKEIVLAHLRTGRDMNSDQAYRLHTIRRLGAIIWTLKREGHAIKRRLVAVDKRSRIAFYELTRDHEKRKKR